jgi:hypothetical protein
MGDRRCHRHLRRHSRGARSRIILAVTAVATVAPPTLAADAMWIGGSGNWNDPTKWSPAGEPVPGGSIFLQQSIAFTNVVVAFNPTLGQAGGDLFNINALNGGLVTFNQAGFLVAFTECDVGANGHGVYNQSGGTHTSGNLSIGFGFNAVSPQSQGTYTLSAGTLTLVDSIIVGYSNGVGTFTQSGGAVTISVSGTNSGDGLHVGFNGGSGTYTLSGGTLNVGHQREYIGYAGAGVFVQSGGAHTIGNTNATAFSPDLLLGYNGGITNVASSGTFILNATSGASTLSILGDEYVGYDGMGNFNQAGASHTVSGTNGIFVGFNAASSGTFTLAGGTLSAQKMVVGYAPGATGTYNQTAGSAHFSGTSHLPTGLIFGYSNGASGAGSLSGGSLSVDYEESIGYAGRGIFNQSGGSNLTAYFTLGSEPTGSGTVNLSGGTLTTTGNTFVGLQGSGTFNHSGGTHNAFMLEIAGVAPSGFGAYSMSNSAVLNVSDIEYLGYGSRGIFTQTGGTHTLTGVVTNLIIGNLPGASGTYTLSGGTLSIPTGYESIGWDGAGVFNQSGGVHFMGTGIGNFNFALGRQSDGSGTYNLSGTGLLTMPQGDQRIGSDGVGVFNQSGGSNVTFFLYEGYSGFSGGGTNPARGVYNQSGGSVTINGAEYVGYLGLGTVNQSGGSHLAASLQLAYYNGTNGRSLGNYALSNTATLTVTGGEIIGVNGLGKFDHTGGTHTIGGSLVIGSGSNSLGTYNLSGGTAASRLAVAGDETIGDQAIGIWPSSGGNFGQTGGYHTVGSPGNLRTLTIANAPGSTGAYTLTDGVLAVSGTSIVGNLGNGTFTQAGGTSSVGNLFIAKGAGSTGTINFSGGNLSAAATVNRGNYFQSGGIASLGPVSGNGTLSIGNASGATARTTVTRFDQSSVPLLTAGVTLLSTGSLIVATNNARFTNTATLSITGNGLLDLGNNDLLTPTPAATIRGYLLNAYTLTNDWSGGRGINCIFASTNPTKYTLGYANGNDPSSQDARPDVPAGQVLVSPTLVGDANLDHRVDFFDITQLLGYKYNTGVAASYTDGDLNYDGKVDFFDLSLLLSANYNSNEVFGAPAAAAEPALATTPEPAGAVIVAAQWAILLLPRRRRTRPRLIR